MEKCDQQQGVLEQTARREIGLLNLPSQSMHEASNCWRRTKQRVANARQDHSYTGQRCRLVLALLDERRSANTMRARTHRQTTRCIVILAWFTTQAARDSVAKSAAIYT